MIWTLGGSARRLEAAFGGASASEFPAPEIGHDYDMMTMTRIYDIYDIYDLWIWHRLTQYEYDYNMTRWLCDSDSDMMY